VIEQRSARNVPRPDSLVAVLARIVQAIAEREAAPQRGKMTRVERPQRDGGSAA